MYVEATLDKYWFVYLTNIIQELIGPYWSLRAALGPLLETFLLLDRLLFLQEQGSSLEVIMLPIFDPEVSPRNVAIIAKKILTQIWLLRQGRSRKKIMQCEKRWDLHPTFPCLSVYVYLFFDLSSKWTWVLCYGLNSSLWALINYMLISSDQCFCPPFVCFCPDLVQNPSSSCFLVYIRILNINSDIDIHSFTYYNLFYQILNNMYCHHKRVFTIDTNVLVDTAIIQCSLWEHIVAFKDYSLQWFMHRYKKDGECIHIDIADWKRVGYGNGNNKSEHTCTHCQQSFTWPPFTNFWSFTTTTKS